MNPCKPSQPWNFLFITHELFLYQVCFNNIVDRLLGRKECTKCYTSKGSMPSHVHVKLFTLGKILLLLKQDFGGLHPLNRDELSVSRYMSISGWAHGPRVHEKYVSKCTMSPDHHQADRGGAVPNRLYRYTYPLIASRTPLVPGYCPSCAANGIRKGFVIILRRIIALQQLKYFVKNKSSTHG